MRQSSKIIILILIVFSLSNLSMFASSDKTVKLPIKDPLKMGYTEVPEVAETAYIRYIENYFTLKQIYDSINDGDTGLSLDLSKLKKALHGGSIDTEKIFGKTYIGPYPMESKEITYSYKRFRLSGNIVRGKGNLYLKGLFRPSINSEDWTDQGQVIIRVELKLDQEGLDLALGTYDVIVRFKIINGKFYKVPTVVEGPFVNMIRSDAAGEVVISFKTSEPLIGGVIINKKNDDKKIRFGNKKPGIKHEIKLSGLKPASLYDYKIDAGGYISRPYTFKTAPKPGKGKVVFSYTADSRAGNGSGDTNYLGVNYRTMERLANLAYQRGSEFFIFGGDLLNGNTSSIDDFRTQIHGWKQTMSGFWSLRPVYTCIGNHESLIKVFENKKVYGKLRLLKMDRWPYITDSTEAVFADEFVYPENGPETSDKRRPTYKENVYSFQYGPVKFIVFNNNYWVAKSKSPMGKAAKLIGGSPEGYIMRDQMDWIKNELKIAENDSNVKYIILYAQEPIFPNGGHVKDCMWYYGNNNVRAYYTDPKTGELIDEGKGIIDVRNEFVRLVGNNKKVAAVLGADEHAFHKTLIDKNVPIGDMKKDDKNNDGIIGKDNESISSLSDLKYPVWYLVSGGGGAPYYAAEPAPWNDYWKKNMNKYKKEEHTSMRGCFYYSSQENVIMFSADKNKISAEIINPYGDVIDKIDDLMAVKK